MHKNLVIDINKLTKKYALGEKEFNPVFRDAVIDAISYPARLIRGKVTKKSFIWALNDLSLKVKRGEVVGVIGKNGAGKSTLLKILSRITEPSSGEVILRGKVGSLIEVGTGFHQELTGRENIYLNGAILGMNKLEVDKKFDQIVKFSGIYKHLDTPIKRYSSGMYVRLAFSVAAHLDTDILLVDEVLSVGDAAFQNKSLGKVKDVAQGGRTVLFVSHNMNAISQLCTRCVVLKNGKIDYDGEPSAAVAHYLSSEEKYFGERKFQKVAKKIVQVRKVAVANKNQKPSAVLDINSPIEISIDYDIHKNVPNLVVGVKIVSTDGSILLISEDKDLQIKDRINYSSGRYKGHFEIPQDLINKGKYTIFASCKIVSPREKHSELLDEQEAFQFECVDGSGKIKGTNPGLLAPLIRWKIVKSK